MSARSTISLGHQNQTLCGHPLYGLSCPLPMIELQLLCRDVEPRALIHLISVQGGWGSGCSPNPVVSRLLNREGRAQGVPLASCSLVSVTIVQGSGLSPRLFASPLLSKEHGAWDTHLALLWCGCYVVWMGLRVLTQLSYGPG